MYADVNGNKHLDDGEEYKGQQATQLLQPQQNASTVHCNAYMVWVRKSMVTWAIQGPNYKRSKSAFYFSWLWEIANPIPLYTEEIPGLRAQLR